MDKMIICNINPMMFGQEICYYNDDKMVATELVDLDTLPEYLVHACYSEDINTVHFFGNATFAAGIIKQLTAEEAMKYNNHKIIIKLN
jgi:hypothetical protein